MPVIRRARTISLVRMLKHFGPLPTRRRRVPRQQQPDRIREAYYRALLPIVKEVCAHAFPAHEVVALLREEREAEARSKAAMRALERGVRGDGVRLDAWSTKYKALELVRKAAEKAAEAFSPKKITDVAKKFGTATSTFQKEQLDQEVRAALGVPLSSIETSVTSQLEGFAALNVDLIKTTSDRYFDRIRLDVLEAFEGGMRPETLAERFVERDGMSENDAMRIARDQIGKLNGQLNEERQKQIGVTGYIWRTAKDNRVRDAHEELDGEHFEWSDPPMGGGTGPDEPGHPGSGIQCRCFAEPDFSALLEG